MFAVLLLTLAAPPTFVVENKMPPVFTVVNRIAAPEVAAPVRTFQRGPAFNASHQCNQCGRSQYRIAGPGPVPGTHLHRCAAGHEWYH